MPFFGFRVRRTSLVAGAFALALALPQGADAQVGPSPEATLTQDISGTEISIRHSRPSVRDRLIFGGQVAFGEFWTPGANVATTIRFSKDLTFGGEEVAAGAYSLWVEASESDMWRVMLKDDTTAFHFPHLTEDDGFLVIEVPHETVAVHQETLLLQIDSIRPTSAVLRMHWGTDRVSVPIGVDLGVILTVEEDEAAKYLGMWSRKMAPWSDEQYEETRAEAEESGQLDGFTSWYNSQLEGQEWEVLYQNQYLLIEQGWGEEFRGLLIPRGNGFFIEGGAMNGQPAFFDPADVELWEFLFDDDGNAIRGEMRDEDGVLTATMERAGG